MVMRQAAGFISVFLAPILAARPLMASRYPSIPKPHRVAKAALAVKEWWRKFSRAWILLTCSSMAGVFTPTRAWGGANEGKEKPPAVGGVATALFSCGPPVESVEPAPPVGCPAAALPPR